MSRGRDGLGPKSTTSLIYLKLSEKLERIVYHDWTTHSDLSLHYLHRVDCRNIIDFFFVLVFVSMANHVINACMTHKVHAIFEQHRRSKFRTFSLCCYIFMTY